MLQKEINGLSGVLRGSPLWKMSPAVDTMAQSFWHARFPPISKGPGLATTPSAQPSNLPPDGQAAARRGTGQAGPEGPGAAAPESQTKPSEGRPAASQEVPFSSAALSPEDGPGRAGGEERRGRPAEGRRTPADDRTHPAVGDPPRIAVYHEAQTPPAVVPLNIPSGGPGGESATPQLIELLTARSYALAREQGGAIPIGVFRELIENLVHASFAGVVITIRDGGNTVRVSDRGPGIPDKEAALRPGFTSADSEAKQFIRGVGSGFSVVKETLAGLGGTLDIEDNLGRGTVVTAHVIPPPETRLTPAPARAYNLPERQLKILLLTVELAPVGPTRVAQELGVSTSTAFRDLVSLEEAGFVVSRPSGHRSATDAGLAYLDAVL